MPFKVLETLNWPGGGLQGHEKKVTGDDRFGFDEANGTAWVIDGATDLGPYRLFKKEESDAAWLAEELNIAFMRRNPANFPDIPAFYEDLLAQIRQIAEKKTRIPLIEADRSALPIASGMWLWHQGESCTFVRSGDCIAVIAPPNGPVEVFEHKSSAELESQTSKKLNAASPEDKVKGLREIRATQNTDPKHAVLGLSPHAVDNLVIETRSGLPEDTHILLMTDGLWRLVDVYGLMSAETLMARVAEEGIEPLAKQLRAHERSMAEKADIRIKASDDACGVLVKL